MFLFLQHVYTIYLQAVKPCLVVSYTKNAKISQIASETRSLDPYLHIVHTHMQTSVFRDGSCKIVTSQSSVLALKSSLHPLYSSLCMNERDSLYSELRGRMRSLDMWRELQGEPLLCHVEKSHFRWLGYLVPFVLNTLLFIASQNGEKADA